MPDQQHDKSMPESSDVHESGNENAPEQGQRKSAAQSLPQLQRPSLTQKQRRIGERIIERGIFLVSMLSIVFIFLIFFFVIREASPILIHTFSGSSNDNVGSTQAARDIVGDDYPVLEHDSDVRLNNLAYDVWQPTSDHPRYGIYPIIIGTIKTTIVALLFAIPIGILAALYTAFFAPIRLREKIKPVIELLAGIPSVVIGFFCLMTVASLVQTIFGVEYRLNAVVGGIGLSLAVIPIIYTITDDALRAVPNSLREAALAIGASEWQAAYQIMLPAATPGVFAAILLGLGRAFGETMIAIMATGNAGTVNWDFMAPVRTFAATIGAETAEVVVGSPHYQVLFLLGVILFIFSFAINFITEFYVKQRLIKKFRGAE